MSFLIVANLWYIIGLAICTFILGLLIGLGAKT